MNSKGRDRNRTAERSLRIMGIVGSLACAAAFAACGGGSGGTAGASSERAPRHDRPERRRARRARPGSALDGVHLIIPPGALSAPTPTSRSTPATATPRCPTTAVRCGPEFTIEPAGLKLAVPATAHAAVRRERRDRRRTGSTTRSRCGSSAPATPGARRSRPTARRAQVTVQVDALTVAAAGVNPPASTDVVHLTFKPNPKFASCLAAHPGDASKRADRRGRRRPRRSLNDGLFLRGQNIKPDLQFDMFTVEHSPLDADGTPDPNFTNFGFAWYQSDLEAESQRRRCARRSGRSCSTRSSASTRRVTLPPDEHLRGRLLVQRPARRRGLRLRRDQADALQRRAQGRARWR